MSKSYFKKHVVFLPLVTLMWACQHSARSDWGEYVAEMSQLAAEAPSWPQASEPPAVLPDMQRRLSRFLTRGKNTEQGQEAFERPIPPTPEQSLEQEWHQASWGETNSFLQSPVFHPYLATHLWSKIYVRRHRRWLRQRLLRRQPAVQWMIHLVSPGETLQSISQKYYRTTRRYLEIYVLNPQLKSFDRIQPGQKLKIWPL